MAVAWHTGFDGLDTFGGILRALARPPGPVRFVVRRIPRHELPSDQPGLATWLDAVWCAADAEVSAALAPQLGAGTRSGAVHVPDRRNP